MHEERVVRMFLDLASTDSASFEEKQIKDKIVTHLKELKLEFMEDDAGSQIGGNCGNIVCFVKGEEGLPAVAFLSHMDTVSPCQNKEPVVIGDIIKTNGRTILGGDDHAGVCVILEMLYRMQENKIPHGDIYAIFTVAEEKGLLGAKHLDLTKIPVQYAFVLDDGGPIGTYSYTAPTQMTFEAKIFGKAAHAGVEPEKGVSAIQILSHAIFHMKLGRISQSTTANVGVLNGGLATNIICDLVHVKGEARSLEKEELEAQIEHMKACFEEAAHFFGGSVSLVAKKEYETYHIKEEHPMVRVLEKASQKAGLSLYRVKSGGGSDTNILNAKGVPSVNLSVGMQEVHTVHEWIRISDLKRATDFVCCIIEEMHGKKH
jgi:tripeptide aminopeptidase